MALICYLAWSCPIYEVQCTGEQTTVKPLQFTLYRQKKVLQSLKPMQSRAMLKTSSYLFFRQAWAGDIMAQPKEIASYLGKTTTTSCCINLKLDYVNIKVLILRTKWERYDIPKNGTEIIHIKYILWFHDMKYIIAWDLHWIIIQD